MIAAKQQAALQEEAMVELQRRIDEREARLRALEPRQIPIRETRRGVELPPSDDRFVLFDPGKAELNPIALAVLCSRPQNNSRSVLQP